jgi:hypothetical protein
MARSLALITILFAVGCSSAPEQRSYSANENLLVTGFPGLPSDARQVAERLGSCSHFAGEINGDGSDRDKEVFSTMAALHCDTVGQDVLAIRQKYTGNQAVQEALDAASQL